MSNPSDEASLDQQRKFNRALNIGRLACLETRLDDFEKIVTEAGEPLLYNGSPVFKYKEEVSGCRIFVLEIPVEWKRRMIEDHYKIANPGAIEEIQKRLSGHGEPQKFSEFIRKNKSYFGDMSAVYDMGILAPQIETGFRIVLVLFPK